MAIAAATVSATGINKRNTDPFATPTRTTSATKAVAVSAISEKMRAATVKTLRKHRGYYPRDAFSTSFTQ